MVQVRALTRGLVAVLALTSSVGSVELLTSPVAQAEVVARPTSTVPAAVAPTATRPTSPAPYVAIDRVSTPLPQGVMPWGPTYAPDGRHVLFQDYAHDEEWVADRNGRHPRCLTCAMTDRPDVSPGFAYVFPDNKRMFLANELGDDAFVLECAPTLFACRSHRWLTVDLSADDNPVQQNLGRRTFHLAPDGIHLGYTITRLDGLVMMVAELRRTSSTTYAAVGHRVVNPRPASPLDTDAAGWANGGSLDELKSFADGGRSILAVVESTAGNVEQVKIDLATGRQTRLTTDPDWDEDGAVAPDSRSVLVASWRTMHRLEPFGLMQGSRPFLTLPAGAAIAIHYVSSQQGFACDLQPWLLPANGDASGTLGQPLNPYAGRGNVIGGNNLAGQSVWSPDSTRVLLQERLLGPVAGGATDYVKQKGGAPHRLTVAVIKRRPTRQVPIVRTQVGSWAPTPQAYAGTFATPRSGVVRGRFGGTASITIGGNLAAGASSVVYAGFSDDRGVVVDGTASITGGPTLKLRYVSDLVATDPTGRRIGSEDIDVIFTQKMPAAAVGDVPSDISGHARATWRGRSASGLPSVAPCPQDFAKRSPLAVSAVRRRGRAQVLVTAVIAGHRRPVSGATVRVGRAVARTDGRGRARLRVRPGAVVVHADAGDTFRRAKRWLR